MKDALRWKFFSYCKSGSKPHNIPSNPYGCGYYDDEWKNWRDWLGIRKKSRREINKKVRWISFLEAREFARSLNLKSARQWRKSRSANSIPFNIPMQPNKIYDEWAGWHDWLGINLSSIVGLKNETTTRRF